MPATPRSIVSKALLKIGVVAAGDVPTADELSDGVDTYNAMVGGLFGQVIGTKLVPYNTQPLVQNATVVVDPGRLFIIGARQITLTLPTQPKEGMRFGVADGVGTLNSYPVTINPNGSIIAPAYGQTASATPIVLNTPNFSASWFYRADLALWQPEGVQLVDDMAIFPFDVVEALTDMLAVRLGAEYGQAAQVTPAQEQMAEAGRETIARRYARRGRTQTDPARAAAPVPTQYRPGA